MDLRPITLTGQCAELVPLADTHASALFEAGRHEEIWAHLDEPVPRTVDDVRAFIALAQRDYEAGNRLPFAIIDRGAGLVVGTTSFTRIRPAHRGLEIGWTWLTPASWGTSINTEAKYLLLGHAFDVQGAIRVAMKTDTRNTRAQRAIAALGVRQEGLRRNDRIRPDGTFRTSIYYSVTNEEWPAARAHLLARLAAKGASLGC
jgi:RimJ/RimL family protein N-acetyltransferase